MKVRSLFSLLFCLFILGAAGKPKLTNVDSLLHEIKSHNKDSNTVNNLLYLSSYFSDKNLSKSQSLAQKAINLAKELKYSQGQAQGLYLIAQVEFKAGKLDLAISHLKQSNRIYKLFKKEVPQARNHVEIGNIYASQGNLVGSIDHFQKAITIYESLNNEEGIAQCYSDLGWINFLQNNKNQAVTYFKKSLPYFKKNNSDKQLALLYNRISAYYFDQGNIDKSREYDFQALMIQERIRDKSGIALSNFNIAKSSVELKEVKRAEGYINYAIKIYKELEDKIGLGKSQIVKATILTKMDKLNEAEVLLNIAIKLTSKANAKQELSEAYEALAELKLQQEKPNEAYKYLKLHCSLNDTLNSSLNMKKFSEMQVKFDTKDKEKELEIIKSKNEKQGDQILLYISLFSFGLIVFSIILFFQIKRNQLRKESNQFLQKKNEIIGKKNQEILDSLMYAKKIQDAMLTPIGYINKIFANNFLLYYPKDIVSGDFYWTYRNKSNNTAYWVIADCTGHGVPGALMSMIGTVMLNEIVITEKEADCNQILKKLSYNLNRYLHSDEEENNIPKEGMALSIAAINMDTLEMEYAGATNPLFLHRNSNIRVFKGDQIFIGHDPYDRKISNFNVQKFQLQQGDVLYGFTDGYTDQIGELTKKKFKVGALKNLLKQIAHLPMEEQKEQLELEFNKHKGRHVQLDDILIMGIAFR